MRFVFLKMTVQSGQCHSQPQTKTKTTCLPLPNQWRPGQQTPPPKFPNLQKVLPLSKTCYLSESSCSLGKFLRTLGTASALVTDNHSTSALCLNTAPVILQLCGACVRYRAVSVSCWLPHFHRPFVTLKESSWTTSWCICIYIIQLVYGCVSLDSVKVGESLWLDRILS